MRIVRYLAEHKLAVLVVVVLLVGQAVCELSLPRMTSNIVDVGIQQSGVEHVAADELSARTFDTAAMLLADDDEALLRRSYTETDDGTYRLNDEGASLDVRDELDHALALPLVAVHYADADVSAALDELRAAYASGMLDKAQVRELVDEATASMGTVSDAMIEQQGLAAAKAEYAVLGYDMNALQMSYLLRTGAAMLALAAASAAIAVLVGFVAARTGAKIGRDLRERLFARVLSFSEGEIGRFSTASLITRGTNDIQLIQMVSIMCMRMVLYAPILALGGIVMVMTTNASMGWIIVVAVVAVFAVIGVLFKVAMPKFRIMQQLIDRVNLVAREMLTGLPVVRATGRESFEEARFDEASADLMKTQLFTNRAMTFMMPAMMLVMNATSVGIVWVGGLSVDAGTIQTGDLIAFITYAMVIIMSFLMIGMVSIMLPRADVAAARIDEVLACKPSVSDPEPASESASAPAPTPVPALTPAPAPAPESAAPVSTSSTPAARHLSRENPGARVEFDDVTFRYDDESENVLEHVSFTAEPGGVLAIIGATGSGKSTVCKLLERFYDVSAGAVRFDGIDVRDLSQAELRAHIGYVPQKAFLFSGTIADNVSYSSDAMSSERIERALVVAQAADFVAEKEEGMLAPIAQGGANVSGGQRQRLAIARALASDARVLVFDDSFSALDYKTDSRLRAELNANFGDVTRVIVAQRISTVMDADCIVVLDEGRVAGAGTHGKLMATCEEYRAIARSQLSEAELARGGDAA